MVIYCSSNRKERFIHFHKLHIYLFVLAFIYICIYYKHILYEKGKY